MFENKDNDSMVYFGGDFDNYNHNIERLITKVENDNNDFHDCNDGDHSDCDGFGGYDYFNDHETVKIWL